jgi:hypothetical protein
VSPNTLNTLKNNLHRLNSAQKAEVLLLIAELDRRKLVKTARVSLLVFIKFIEPDYKIGEHHKRLATLLECLANGTKDRISVNIAPRLANLTLFRTIFRLGF